MRLNEKNDRAKTSFGNFPANQDRESTFSQVKKGFRQIQTLDNF